MTHLIAVIDTRTYDDNGEPEPMDRDQMEVCQNCGKRIYIVYEVEHDGKVKLIGSECYRKLVGRNATKHEIQCAMLVPQAREIAKIMSDDNLKGNWVIWTYEQRQSYYNKFSEYSHAVIEMASKIYNMEVANG